MLKLPCLFLCTFSLSLFAAPLVLTMKLQPDMVSRLDKECTCKKKEQSKKGRKSTEKEPIEKKSEIKEPADLKTENIKERSGTLEFKKVPKSKVMASATLCADDEKEIKHIELWMPTMGHGSSPVKETHDPHAPKKPCKKLEKMSFSMTGLWYVRVRYNDGSIYVFEYDVKE